MSIEESIERKRVLIVDDEEAVLSSLKSLLRKEGYDLVLSANPEEALEYLKNNKIEIVITDMRMPSMSGLSFLEKAVAKSPKTLRIILSGYEDRKIILGAITSGYAHAYLMKPWDDMFLKRILSKAAELIDYVKIFHIDEILNNTNYLPSSPKFSTYVAQLINQENISIDELTESVEKNPAFVAKILQISNSVYIGTLGRIKSVKEAIQFLGTNYVISLLTSFEIFNDLYDKLDNQIKAYIDDWLLKSSQRAILLNRILKEEESSNRDVCFLAAMFYNVGSLVRAVLQPKEFMNAIDLTKKEGMSILWGQEQIFGPRHLDVGAVILELWNFPQEVSTLVHDFSENNKNHKKEVEYIKIADYITNGDYNLVFEDEQLKEKYLYWKNKLNF